MVTLHIGWLVAGALAAASCGSFLGVVVTSLLVAGRMERLHDEAERELAADLERLRQSEVYRIHIERQLHADQNSERRERLREEYAAGFDGHPDDDEGRGRVA